jgi:chromosome segregation ATPase
MRGDNIKSLEQTTERFREQLLNARYKVAEYERLHSIHTTENKALTDDNFTLNQQIQKLKVKCVEQEKKYKQAIQRLQQINERYRAQLLDTHAELAEYQHLYSIHTTKNKAPTDDNFTLNQQIQQLKVESVNQKQKYKQVIQTLQQTNEQYRAQFLDAYDKVAEYQRLHSIHTTENKSLTDKNFTLNQQIQQLKVKSVNQKQKYKQVIQTLQQTNAASESSFQAILAKKTNEIANLESKLFRQNQEMRAYYMTTLKQTRDAKDIAIEYSILNNILVDHHYQNEIISRCDIVTTLEDRRLKVEEKLAELRNIDELSGINERYNPSKHKPRNPEAGDIQKPSFLPTKEESKTVVQPTTLKLKPNQLENQNPSCTLFQKPKNGCVIRNVITPLNDQPRTTPPNLL